MKQKNKQYNDPISSLILGLITNRNPPILRRDSDGDIASKYSDEDMVLEGLRHDKVTRNTDILKRSTHDLTQLSVFRGNHKRYGKALNSQPVKQSIMGQVKKLMDDGIRIRMNAKFIVVGL